MSKDIAHKRRDVIAEEAANFLVELEAPRAGTKAKFADWLKTSPEHVEEFLAVASLWGALPGVAGQPSIEELIELATRDDNVVELSSSQAGDSSAPAQTPGRPSRGSRRILTGIAAAAALAAVSVGGILMLQPPTPDPNLYTTAIGEQTSLPLPDGSIVTLNTQSALRVEYTGDFRNIHLVLGEALFDVAKDPDRPFRVITEHAVIRAVGTQFNVRQKTDDVTVTVVEGIVDVSATAPRPLSGEVANLPRGNPSSPSGSGAVLPPAPPEPTRLTVGQQARVFSQSGEVAVVDAAVDKATAWRERRLVFESLTLGDVIDEFNRYNDPPLLIDDEALKRLPINGVFRANDRESFVAFLHQMRLAEAQTRADGTIVLRGLERDQ